MSGSARFRFLSTERQLASPEDWNHPSWPKLWLYNLHYFDDLVADGATTRRDWHHALIDTWIRDNSPGKGTGWEPYPTSLRIVNWIKWALAGNSLSSAAVHSLAVQTRWLCRRLEYHLLGNHLWANAKALVFAGAFFEGFEAAGWLRRGLRLLRRQLEEQILADGGHFEGSPMYHSIVLADVLDLIQLVQRYPELIEPHDEEAWRGAATRMLRWLRAMTHPDGNIAFFNDASFGIAPTVNQLHEYAIRLGLAVDDAPLSDMELLRESGYARLKSGAAVLIADVGEIGPAYLPGHAHADTLSFELSVNGQRVVVNGGTSTYETGPERLGQRGTGAHNTVVVDHQDSSEVWGSFRVARRARPFDVRIGREEGRLWLEAAHDGYLRLPGRVVHRRRWELSQSGLEITDHIDGGYSCAEAFLHVHPELVVMGKGAAALISGQPDIHVEVSMADGAIDIELGAWHPRFGVTLQTKVLRIPIQNNRNRVLLSWR